MKKNPRAFYKYANRKGDTKCRICNLEKENGALTKNYKETAEKLNRYFALCIL